MVTPSDNPVRLVRVRGANATATWTWMHWECVTTWVGGASNAWGTQRATTANAAGGDFTVTPWIPQPAKNANVRAEGLNKFFLFFFFFLFFYLNPFDGDNYVSTSLEWYQTLPISGLEERYKRSLRMLHFMLIQFISRIATLALSFRSFSCTLTSSLSIRNLLDSHQHKSH